jgi:hypothetical protein
MGVKRPAAGTIQSEMRTCEFKDTLSPDWFLICMAVLCQVRVFVTEGLECAWGNCFSDVREYRHGVNKCTTFAIKNVSIFIGYSSYLEYGFESNIEPIAHFQIHTFS